VFRYDGNIIQFDQYTTELGEAWYFMRLEFAFDPGYVPTNHIHKEFAILAKSLEASWVMHDPERKLKMGILVSGYSHCLVELLYRCQSGELNAEIPFVISNHEKLSYLAEQFGVPFYHIPVSKGDKRSAERRIVELADSESDFLVLARYMQILTQEFLDEYSKDVINIHHSFLPSFKGADPYKQAFERGVKVIGATAHFVTADLDEGPIIEQLVERVSHRDIIPELKRKGKNIEKAALANAVQAYSGHRVIRYKNRTVVFQ
ncbi:MAG: formyltetrahydrofolate deformylase, partial [Chitinivibrionales bacterium]